MKSFQIIAIAALSAFCISCGNGKKTEDNQNDSIKGDVMNEKGILSKDSIQSKDTVTVDGKLYTYSFVLHPVDSLPTITYPTTGAVYYDNEAVLVITQDGKEVIRKTFTKATFKSHIPDKIYDACGLVGFNYNIMRQINHEDRAFYFIVTIGSLDDEEEVGYSLEVKMDTQGGMSVSKFEDTEVEPQSQGMTVDPPTDEDGV